MKLIIRVFLVTLLFVGCRESVMKTNSNYTNGRVENRLEDGIWVYFSKDNIKDTTKVGEYDSGFKLGDWQYFFPNHKSTISWKKYKSNLYNTELSYPASLSIIQQKDKSFLGLEGNDNMEFYVVIQQPPESGIDSLSEYLEKIYEVMKADTLDVFTGYTLNKVVFDNGRITYSGQLFTEYKGQKYITFVFYTKDNKGDIIDVSRRTKAELLNEKQVIFNDFVYGIFSEGKKLFYVDDYVESEELVKLDTVK